MVAIKERKKRKTAQRGSKNYRPGNFQASYARKFADWIVIKRDANNQVMEAGLQIRSIFNRVRVRVHKKFASPSSSSSSLNFNFSSSNSSSSSQNRVEKIQSE